MSAKRSQPIVRIDPRDIPRLADEAHRDVRTVLSVYAGTAGKLATLSVREAAQRLGIPFPGDS
jgi:hypothetical protein